MQVPFSRLIRFRAPNGLSYYGQPILPPGIRDIAMARQAHVITGDIWKNPTLTNHVADVRKLLSPLAPYHIGTVRCLGLNYRDHVEESNMPVPNEPVVFYKPFTAVTGPFNDILIPAIAQQNPSLDYESELVVVIGRQGKDVPESQALDFVLGYAAGNDVSHRHLQLERGGGQWSMGKGFDRWAPFGPGIVTKELTPTRRI
ncbi:hypothetical protein MFIFM68171_01042 [Madurella fahalii]|uniref:Fumarylacetoacetase-like C-terminal domain-containing protein n=1 Tax=Madurella fahalii TaxID=1157608 RepID=A0ABQ0FZA1_9PEZI